MILTDRKTNSCEVVCRALGIVALVAVLFVAGCSQNGPATLTVITTSSALPAGSVSAGGSYPSTTLAASGGTAPYTWALTAGSNLPPGLSLSGSGTISGNPTTAGTFTFSVTVTDSAVPVHTAPASLTITINPILAVSSSGTLTQVGEVGGAYSAPLAQTGGVGPFTWTLAGASTLPTGLTLGTNGTITGTIAGSVAANTYSFKVKVSDSQGNSATSSTISIKVDAALVITPPSFPTGVVGVAYTAPAFSASGGSGTGYTYAVATGSIGNLNIAPGTGAITGTPAASGTLSFTVKVTDSLGYSVPSSALTITINPAIAVSIPTTPNPVTLDQAGSKSVTASVANDPNSAGVNWTISSGAGSLSGASTTAVTYNAPSTVTTASSATVKATSVTDPTKFATFSVNLVPPPAISPATLPGGNVGTPYSQTLSVTSGIGPYTWSISSGTPPVGVTFTPGATTATLTGIPTTASTYPFTVKVTDSGSPQQSSSVLYSVLIGPPLPLNITNSSLPGGALNTAYGPVQINATGGLAPYSFGATGLPTGMTLSSGGSLTGTPTQAGTGFSVVITVTDSATPTANTNNKTLALTITSSPLILTPGTGSLPNASQTVAYTTSLTPSGGLGPYTIALDGTSAAMPAGLTFNATSASTAPATITGTPTATGTTTGIIVDVTDSETPAVMTQFTYSLAVQLACGAGSESLLNGQYAFVLRGFDSSGNVAIIGGVLTADGHGKLSAGAVDMNLAGGVQSNLAIASGSNYTMGSDGRGCMAITTSAGTQNYRFSVAASGNGHMIDFDAAGPFTAGVLRMQTPSAFSTAQISGNYAFGSSSPQDSADGGGKLAAMGVLNLSAGKVTGGFADYNDYNAVGVVNLDGVSGATAWPASPETINSSGSNIAYAIGTNGRGTLTFTLSDGSVVNAYIYVVSSNEMLLISSAAHSSSAPLFAGTAYKQTGTPYSLSSASGTSVLYDSQLNNNGGTLNSSVGVGLVTKTSGGSFTFAGYNNGGGNISTPTNNNASGTFTVAANGRVVISASGGGGNQLPLFYLFSPGSAFAVFSGSGADEGLMELQTTTSVANGNYTIGTFDPQTAHVSDKSGIFALSSGTVTPTSDINSQGTLSPNNTGPDTYSVDSTGVVFVPASCTPGATTGTICTKIGAVVSGSKIIIMNANPSAAGGTSNPSVQILDQ